MLFFFAGLQQNLISYLFQMLSILSCCFLAGGPFAWIKLCRRTRNVGAEIHMDGKISSQRLDTRTANKPMRCGEGKSNVSHVHIRV
jgi:hypothetical protein